METKSLTEEFVIERIHKNAQLPSKGSPEAAGYDLYCVDDVVIHPGGRVLIPIGIKSQIPKGYYGRIADRSGLAAKHGLTVQAGVIDSDYRGEWRVLLHNTGPSPHFMPMGSRVAQAVLTKIADFDVVEIQDVDETPRGGGGFGSTGI